MSIKVGSSPVPTPAADAAPDTASPAPVSPDPVASADAFSPATVGGLVTLFTGNPVLGGVAAGATGLGNSVGASLAQSAQDSQKLKDIHTELADSPTGAAAMKYLDDNKIPVKFANGGGSYWDGKQIVIDRSESTQSAALTLVHEINHAKADKTGTTGNVSTQTRADYVDTMLNEEVKGTVLSIQAKNEKVAKGDTVNATFPLEGAYNTAYKKAVDDLKAKDPKASDADLKAAGEKAGYDRVMKGFKDGEVVTSVDGKNYPDYYGGGWDAAHPKN